MKTAIIGNCKTIGADDLYALVGDTEVLVGGTEGLAATAMAMAERYALPIQGYAADYGSFGRRATVYRTQRLVRDADSVLIVTDGYCPLARVAVAFARKKAKRYRHISYNNGK